jgi:hypothetical protein
MTPVIRQVLVTAILASIMLGAAYRVWRSGIPSSKIAVAQTTAVKSRNDGLRAWGDARPEAPAMHLVVDCATRHRRIHIHDLGTEARYLEWAAGSSVTEMPQVMGTGTWEPDGSGGSRHYRFPRDASIYEMYVPALCSGKDDNCEPHLTVTEGKRVLADEVCRHINPGDP